MNRNRFKNLSGYERRRVTPPVVHVEHISEVDSEAGTPRSIADEVLAKLETRLASRRVRSSSKRTNSPRSES